MPLIHGKSKATFGHNVSAEVRAGKPLKQAVAIAYNEKDKAMKYAQGGEVDGEMDDMEMMLDQVASEFLEAVEKKDRQMMLKALEALVLHIKDEDEKQDAMEAE